MGEEEIRKSPLAKFENRNDKFASPEKKAAEVEVGKGLHNEVSSTDKPVTMKGFTIQRFYPDEKNKYGGDILTINKNSEYGHINSIRRILSIYIQNSFEYTEKNADKLVSQVLNYNAQNRKNLDNIKKRYTDSLVQNLNKNKVGISKKFSEWPGNTQIVIPIKSGIKPEFFKETKNSKDGKTPKDSGTSKIVEDSKTSKDTQRKDSKTAKDEKVSKDATTVNAKDSKIGKDTKDSKEAKSLVEKNPKTDLIDETSKDSKTSKKTAKSAKIGKDKIVEKINPKDSKSISDKDTIIKEEKKSLEEREASTTPTKIALNEIDPKNSSDAKTSNDAKTVKDAKTDSKDLASGKDDDIKNTPPPLADLKSDGNDKSKTAKEIAKNETPKTAPVKIISGTSSATVKPPERTPPRKEESKPVVQAPKKEPVVVKKEEVKLPKTKDEIKKMKEELTVLKEKEKDRAENSENVFGDKIVFLKVKEYLADGHYVSEMWAVDTENDDELFASPFKKVCGKDFKELATGVVVMCFKENNTSKDSHHLALLNKEDLKLIKQTKEVIFWRSFMKEQNGKIFAIEELDGKYYLSQFGSDLSFEKRSSDPINPDCEIAFKKNKIYMTVKNSDGKEVSIRVLDRETLKLRDLKSSK